MLIVVLALAPGLMVSTYFFGFGVLINAAVGMASAMLFEAFILKLRNREVTTLADGSAAVTGLLLGLALPPDLPAWMLITGAMFAIVFGKHMYGGLGQNPFNPAMVGYAVLILSFPLAMSTWPALVDGVALNRVALNGVAIDGVAIDGVTAATPLDTMKFRGASTVDEIWSVENGFATLSGIGWQWINIAYLFGGLILIILKVARWQAPAAMLLTLSLLAAVFYDDGSSQSLASPVFHLLSGGTMLAAFFVVTDPVTSPDSEIGLYIFGFGIGLITFIIRSFGAYPDGFAFSILLMNAMVPLIEQIRLRTQWTR